MGTSPLPDGNDESIHDDAVLWRRIPPVWWQLNPETGTYHLSAGAFQNYPKTNNMSVGIAAEIEGPEAFIKGFDGYGVAALTAGYARRECNQAVARAPEKEQPWHAHVIGRKKDREKNRLRAGATVLIEPKPSA